MRQTNISPEEAMRQVQKIFKKRGTNALEMARKETLQEKIECKEVKEALTYFMTQYWNDLARPSLLSLVCEAVGGEPELTTPIAVPMILISGAIDIHDDIIDQSKIKGGRSTVYGKYGRDIALLVGDALLFKGLTLLNETVKKGVPLEKLYSVINIVQKMFFELGDAEALELSLRKRMDVSPEKYLQIVRKKAADVEAHLRIGAILGEASKREIKAIAEYGRLLGMMLILRDDWVDIFDLEESRHRIEKESLPLPILYGMQNQRAKLELSHILQKKAVTLKDAESIMKTIQKTEAINEYKKLMQKLAQTADSKLKGLKNKETLTLLVTTLQFSHANRKLAEFSPTTNL